MNYQIASAISDAGIRIAGIWPIAGLTESAPDEFTKAIDGLPLDDNAANILGCASGSECDPDMVDFGSLTERIFDRNEFGYFGLIDCPVYKAHPGGGASCSWGYYRQCLFYDASLEKLLERAVSWGKDQFKAAVAKKGAAA